MSVKLGALGLTKNFGFDSFFEIVEPDLVLINAKKSLPKVQPAEHMRQRGGKQWEQPQWQFPEQVRSPKVNIFSHP